LFDPPCTAEWTRQFGTGVILDPFFTVPNLGSKRAKGFQSLLDCLIKLAPTSDNAGQPSRLVDLEAENRATLYGLTECLSFDDDEAEVIGAYLDKFFLDHPSRADP
jgi:hypothetical protein